MKTPINILMKEYWPYGNLTFNEFSALMNEKHNWNYEPLYGAFSYMVNGKKVYVNSRKAELFAAFYGYSGSL